MDILVVFLKIRLIKAFDITNPLYKKMNKFPQSLGTSLNRGSTVLLKLGNNFPCIFPIISRTLTLRKFLEFRQLGREITSLFHSSPFF